MTTQKKHLTVGDVVLVEILKDVVTGKTVRLVEYDYLPFDGFATSQKEYKIGERVEAKITYLTVGYIHLSIQNPEPAPVMK